MQGRELPESLLETQAGRFFARVTAFPGVVLCLALALVAGLAALLPRLENDTRNKAYMPADHPAMVGLDRVKELFGVSDEPVVVAVIRDAPDGVFTPEVLRLVDWLTERIEGIPGVDPDRVTSLATENDIVGTEEGMVIEPFFEEPPATRAGAESVREAVLDFELYVDRLVAADGRATLIVVELLDPGFGEAVYEEIVAAAEQAPPAGAQVHVAGLGAYNALIGDYIDADIRRLNPIAGAFILAMLVLAYRTPRGVLIPGIAVAGAALGAYGPMAGLGVPVYGITTTMSVILIAIGVCNGIHVMGQYYVERARHQEASGRELAVRALVAMWRPVLITSVTTMAGFLALSIAMNMPPMRWYGLFAALGVATAFLLSLLAMPAALTLLPPRGSRAFLPASAARPDTGVDRFGRSLAALGGIVHRRPRSMVAVAAVATAVGAVGAARLTRDNDYMLFLDSGEPLYRAERAINAHIGGINTLDVVVETDEVDGLVEPERLRRIGALQRHLETLPRVTSTSSLVDFVKQIHRAMNADAPEFYAVPDDPDLVAQYLLAYSAAGDPADLEEVVDYDRRLANVRVSFDRARWSDARVIVAEAQRYLDAHFNAPDLRGELAGIVNVLAELDLEVARSQWVGVLLAFLAVFGAVAVCFRSLFAGALAVLPVGLSMLIVYGVMGFAGIWLNLATSMTGAIAIGVSVDFAVHTIDRMIELLREEGRSMVQAFAGLFPSTGRALFFNFLAVLFGFGVLITSSVPTVREFGVLVVVCVTTSFAASVTFLPALILLLRPGFLSAPERRWSRVAAASPRES